MIKADFELWKDIKGFEGLYQVSTWARVRSLDRWVVYKNGRKRFLKGKILKYSYSKSGYIQYSLYKSNKMFTFKLHRLVAEAFIHNTDILPEVNHKDEDKTNNYPFNLEYCTRKYNHNYGTRNKRAGESNKNGKCSKKVYQYDLNYNLLKVWLSVNECGRNGFDFSHISKCCLGKQKTHKGFIWSYEELS